ncbi:radical SAM protein [Candidatus Parcubacteria bacterium]|nr:radical SAM protein [Candidatus Parcubacteria bacterium]
MNSIILMTTYECNASCYYCPIKKKKKRMAFSTAKKAIDLFLDFGNHNKKIKFFGGEPLMEYNLIKKCIEHAGNKASYELATNGILLNKDRIDFLSAHGADLAISFDFIKKKPFSVLRLVKKNNYLDKITATLMAAPQNIDFLSGNFTELVQAGVKKFNILPTVYTTNWTESRLGKLEKELEKIAEKYWQIKNKGEYIYLKGFEEYEDESLKEMPLASHNLFVDVNGDIFSSDLILVMPEQNKSAFKLGNVKHIQSLNQISRINNEEKYLSDSFDSKVIINNRKIKIIMDNANKLIKI